MTGMDSQKGFASGLIIWAISLTVLAVLLHAFKVLPGISRLIGKLPPGRKSQAFLLFVLCLGGRLALLHEKPVPAPVEHTNAAICWRQIPSRMVDLLIQHTNSGHISRLTGNYFTLLVWPNILRVRG